MLLSFSIIYEPVNAASIAVVSVHAALSKLESIQEMEYYAAVKK